MINLSLAEAQLMRLLESFFGQDRIIYGMSTFAVADGIVPNIIEDKAAWIQQAKTTPCQFVILDFQENPRLVITLNFDYDGSIDLSKLDQHNTLSVFLEQLKIPYVPINSREFAELIDRNSGFTLVHLLQPVFTSIDA